MATGSRASEPRTPRNFGLDVLRAFAILLVLASHYGQAVPRWFGARAASHIPAAIGAYGTYGVVVFFALSGFLVGGIALRAMSSGPSLRSIGTFLVRRWMRTVPLYYAAILLFLAATPPSTDWLHHVLSYATFTQNFASDMPSDRWFATSWSLTVEEWFYLGLGTAGLGLARLVRPGVAAWCCVVILVGMPTLLRWALPSQMWFAYADVLWFDCIAFGLALARIVSRWRIPVAASVLLAGAGAWCGWTVLAGRLLLPAVLFVTLMPSTMATSAVLLIPLALHWKSGRGWPATVVRWISTRSYGLYLFHPVVLHLIGSFVVSKAVSPAYGAPHWLALAGIVAAMLGSCLLAELGHRLVERPIMRLRPRETATRPVDALVLAV